jgi:pyruvate kinase
MTLVSPETRTKIVATLGPASWDEPMLVKLFEAGVDVARINCSHSDPSAIRRQVARVRRAATTARRPIAILLDLQGPKIRTGKVETPIPLRSGDVLTIVMADDYVVNGRRVGTTYPQMSDDVFPGVKVLFADGALSGEVSAVRRDISPAEVDVRIIDGGALGSHKGINVPEVPMSIPCLTEKDLADLAVGIESGVDYVALSFVQRAADVIELREHITRLVGSGYSPWVISKIEKPQAVKDIDAILAVSDGVMVARGDLGVEVPIEEVPVYQKLIIERATRTAKLVITATQMLDSMERNPRPTRAETTDVANAILDGTDAVMLSGETSVGKYPIEAVSTMDRIARSVESSRFFRSTPPEMLPDLPGPAGALCRAAGAFAGDGERPIVVCTWSGETARYISKLRPKVPIFALSPRQEVVDQLALAWGVTSMRIPAVKSTDDLVTAAERILVEAGHLTPGNEVVMISGLSSRPGSAHFMKVYVVGRSD